MICRENNITKSTLLSGKDKNPKKGEKLCFCDEENGFMENVIEKHCNGKYVDNDLVFINS